ncbi:unnamed protein product [Candidula unifasciata]|uniref:Uncharacterized protein n=1 Tax=Candidula unifasciata TaxID=100452 RepID=A0A8S3YTW3_9EUPU|nr:unnamed protein product [Candidula unifasciata]
MEHISMVQLLIRLLCCAVVADLNVAIGLTAAGTSRKERSGFTTQCALVSTQRRYLSDRYIPTVTNPSSTVSSQFVCANGSGTINRALLCNGRIDCPDSSDENSPQCDGISCINLFPCLNRKCVGLNSVCNGINDCGDNSDEDPTICRWVAASKVFKCGTGQILKGENIICNGIYNCRDRTDELYCSLCPEGLSCDKGRRCVKVESICDRVQDCYDGADETCFSPNNQKCNVGDFICPTGICVKRDHIMSGSSCWVSQNPTREDNQKYCKSPNVLCDGGNKCIPPEYRCDGKRDCQDGTDEMSPDKNIMSDPSYKCGNGYCVSHLALCNGTNECGDNSDEDFGNGQCPFSAVNCSSVAHIRPPYWQCDNGLCVPPYQVNNGINNCGDSSDEKNSTVIYFTCTNGKKLLRSFLCNSRDDCDDSSDESAFLCAVNTTRPACSQASCPSGKCLNYRDFCDGFNDCGDNSDELSCPLTPPCRQHTCPSGKCINVADVCNLVNDCGDNSDEAGCPSCFSFQFTCNSSGQCLPSSKRCNGVKDCSDNSDEIGCAKPCFGHTCPSGTCILNSQMCNGVNDCGDNSDESNWTCSSTICSSTFCISASWTFTPKHVATGISVPSGFVIFGGGCCFWIRRRRRLRSIRGTRMARAVVTNATTNELPSYEEAVGRTVTSEGVTNPAYDSSASVPK